MHKKHIFLRVFQKITIFACVFCAFSAWAETTTCDINYTPVTGNSIQNGTPTPTTPVAIESIGTKVGNKYQISVVAQGKNLFDSSVSTIEKQIIQRDADSSVENNNYHIYDYQPIGAGTYTLTFNEPVMRGASLRLNLYNSKKEFVSQALFSNELVLGKQSFTFTVSQNGYYRINPRITTIDIMVTTGTEVPESYIPWEHSTTPIYLNAPLRKVGDYADVLDYKKGQIIRNVGVKVFDGTENWVFDSTYDRMRITFVGVAPAVRVRTLFFYTSHYKVLYNEEPLSAVNPGECYFGENSGYFYIHTTQTSSSDFKSWLAQQYANGTPVTVYYPLATPVVEQIENWSCTPPITDIKIATTKMVDEEFAQAEANLAATVQTIESVVSRTIAQTGQIQVLQDTKQTRPDENCPANMKCLLVQDEDGTPHWYPIIEP